MEEESMEDVAMNGKAMEKKERKRLRHLEKVKRSLGLDACCNDEPIDTIELAESFIGILEGLKDPLVKEALGAKKYKLAVNSLIDTVTVIKSAAAVDAKDLMTKI